MFDFDKWLRPNVLRMNPYSCARNEFSGEATVYIDANENPYNTKYNRYPDPLQIRLKSKISQIKGVETTKIFLGNGSDEPIDLLYRVSCEPGQDNVVAINPTYGMYKVCADTNCVEYRNVSLNEDFDIDVEAVLNATDEKTKLIWVCSPNNPTGNSLDADKLEYLIANAKCVVVLDEAYIDFSSKSSFLTKLDYYPNLVILQTLSKAWGLAGLRLGMAFACESIVGALTKIKYPYNINSLTQEVAYNALCDTDKFELNKLKILTERERLYKALLSLPIVKKVFPTDANFWLVKVDDPNAMYNYLTSCGIIVRNRNSVSMCEGCLRITVGTASETDELIVAMRNFR